MGYGKGRKAVPAGKGCYKKSLSSAVDGAASSNEGLQSNKRAARTRLQHTEETSPGRNLFVDHQYLTACLFMYEAIANKKDLAIEQPAFSCPLPIGWPAGVTMATGWQPTCVSALWAYVVSGRSAVRADWWRCPLPRQRALSAKHRKVSGPLPKAAAMVLEETDAGKRLTSAAAGGRLAEVRRLLQDQRLPPDTVNEFGKTALQVMMMGCCSLARALLERGADPNVQDHSGVTPAHDAARTGFLETLRILVEFGAGVNVADSAGALPIHVAIAEGHADVVEFLAPRSDLGHRDAGGRTALDLARASSCPDMVQLLEKQLESSL
ncbi:cyclin-dependent kinase 4 inhibitor D-like isoform X6 [Lepisosteus oculatus]|uniref:cyclin-dependent kinase 4 inhibitor D-like isoform X6 n=1 Tax=Lepisosteus oculatus TaxID=7918 RepID=UPI00370F91EB